MSDRARTRPLLLGAAAFFLLNYAWELVHAPLFDFSPSLHRQLYLLLCAVGDLALGAAAYASVALVSGRWRWPVDVRWRLPAAAWIVLGLVITVAVEAMALRRGLWAYRAAMPTVAGVALTPLIQWLVVPGLTLVLVRARMRPRPRDE